MDSLVNNPIHVLIHLLCFWLGGKIADRTNFFNHHGNTISHMSYAVLWIFILFSIGAKFGGVYIGLFNGNDPESIKKVNENWLGIIGLGLIIFILGYLFTLITARLGISKPYEPEGTWVYGDVCLKSMRNALIRHSEGKEPLSNLLKTLDNNYKPVPWESASRKWKKLMKARIGELRDIDSRDFNSGRKGLSIEDQNRLTTTLEQVDALLSQAEVKLVRCFERRKHEPRQWYR